MKRLLLLVTCVPTLALAADWRLVVGTALGKQIIYIDASTIETGKNERQFWATSVYKDTDSRGAKSNKMQLRVRCAERQFTSMYSVTYRDDGSVITSYAPESVTWKTVVPDSLAESMFALGCGTRKSILSATAVSDPINSAKFIWTIMDEVPDKTPEVDGSPPRGVEQGWKSAPLIEPKPAPCRFDEYGVAICNQ